MIQILHGTPFWVYLILFALIARGIKACKENTIKLKKAFITPVVFFFLSLHSIHTPYTYAIFFILGLIIGYLIFRHMKTEYDKPAQMIKMQGSVIPLILMLGIFAKSYFLGYITATNPALLKAGWVILFTAIASGTFSGILIGRGLVILQKIYPGLK